MVFRDEDVGARCAYGCSDAATARAFSAPGVCAPAPVSVLVPVCVSFDVASYSFSSNPAPQDLTSFPLFVSVPLLFYGDKTGFPQHQ